MSKLITRSKLRETGRYKKIVERINFEWKKLKNISDHDLSKKTNDFKLRFSNGESPEFLVFESFATVKEVVYRIFNMTLFDSQLIGGLALYEGKVAEMQTGEGKTMIGMLAAYLNSISGNSVHIITANEYLAKRDEQWMRPLYNFLGISSSVNLKLLNSTQKKEVYTSSVLYGTSSEFCFDYLRDGTTINQEKCVQKSLDCVIIDELDSILIDEAKTPMVISSNELEKTELHIKADGIIQDFLRVSTEKYQSREMEKTFGDYVLDEREKNSYLTESGYKKIESLLVKRGLIKHDYELYSSENLQIMYYIIAALKAHVLYKKDIDYIIRQGQIVIVDERTGRLSHGKRWSEGLHQAIEAKEGLDVKSDSKTISSITIQNYFRMYTKISGMTGTADSESFELSKIYNLSVMVIPTNKPVSRDDREDLIYTTEAEKNSAIIKEILECYKRKQPVLVGTTSIEQSEKISYLLHKEKIPHQVLNAKQDIKEASIIEEAGKLGAITIATNMAGRGTDIILGGRKKDRDNSIQSKEFSENYQTVVKVGGLHVIGTERQTSRRLDNQLKGRSGRQGDPGSSQFYLSFDDNLLKNITSEKIKNLTKSLSKNGKIDGHRMISRVIRDAQYRSERMGFDARKGLMEYDDIIDKQRQLLNRKRLDILKSQDVITYIENAQIDAVQLLIHRAIFNKNHPCSIEKELKANFNVKISMQDYFSLKINRKDLLFLKILFDIRNNRKEFFSKVGRKILHDLEKEILLVTFDQKKRDYMLKVDNLTKSMHFHQYTQSEPTRGYRMHACEILRDTIRSISYKLTSTLSKYYKNL